MGAELGLTSAQLAGAFSLAVLLTGAAGVSVGRWLDTHGPRALMTAGAAASAILVAAWSQVQGAAGLYLVLGWRDTLLVLAGALAVLTVLPHWIVLRRDPADLGLHPDGADGPPPRHPLDELDPEPAPPLKATAPWAARHAAFRWYAAAFASQATAVVIVAVHLVPYLRETGHTGTFAAAATGSLGALSVTGRLVLTGTVRRIPVGHVAAAMFTIQAAGIGVLLLAGHHPAGVIGFVLLFGIGFGVGTVARPALLARASGSAGTQRSPDSWPW